ncbi:MATE family efflux transporter [Pseudokordiimonas caeni]|uniref:MATE family efflux transporter n=1 Tax=Pseudokordiimonas caeni TaxID=2997908 RepID=UPI0028118EE9|nr:MATE family efflux transporter [Pseudokordiimonas caeni]
MSDQAQQQAANPYLEGSLSRLYVKTALPMILVMMINGLYTVVDAAFIGHFVGPEALSAVTLMFPVFMFFVALGNLVGGGMVSIVARRLGAGDVAGARDTFGAAQLLTVVIWLLLNLLYFTVGKGLILAMAAGDAALAGLSMDYIGPLVVGAVLNFFVGVHWDALRAEGKVGATTLIAVAATFLNGVFNYILIVQLQMGVFGSAIGTLMAQGVAFVLVYILRKRGNMKLPFIAVPHGDVFGLWKRILTLGLPPSLSFLGVSLVSGLVIFALQGWAGDGYGTSVAAYGVITRISGFTFLPLLGLSMAAQAIVGNNFGAERYDRSDGALRVALASALGYCALMEGLMIAGAPWIGSIFVSDAAVINEVGRIMPLMMLTFFIFGPCFILSGYFQALGDARMAAFMGLAKPYLFSLPLILLLPFALGERGIWLSSPVGDVALTLIAIFVLTRIGKRTGARFGLFRHTPEAA